MFLKMRFLAINRFRETAKPLPTSASGECHNVPMVVGLITANPLVWNVGGGKWID